MPGDSDVWAVRLDCPPVESSRPPTVMFAQLDVPVQKGRWYRISLKAKAERLVAGSVTVTVTDTRQWRSLFEYQRFQPEKNWRTFDFLVQARGTATEKTRFQIWYTGPGRLWLANVQLQAIPDPSQGRWQKGLYLDTPTEWDDPYRFFRW